MIVNVAFHTLCTFLQQRHVIPILTESSPGGNGNSGFNAVPLRGKPDIYLVTK